MELSMTRVSSLWAHLDYSSATWQDLTSYSLAALYGLVGAVSLIQLIRIESRVPEFGWTTQKVFHLCNFLVYAWMPMIFLILHGGKNEIVVSVNYFVVRSIIFALRRDVQEIKPEVFQHVLIDLPSLAFFTTYVLLVLFWAEIYYQARAMSTDYLRPAFYTINAIIYSIQIALWFLLWWSPIHHMIVILCKLFFSGVSMFAAFGFLLYGGRLFMMLHQFPVESKGRNKKLNEVGYVSLVCFSCFSLRCIMMFLNAFDMSADLDVMVHPLLNFFFYLLVEIVPSCLVLVLLRKLPSRQVGPLNPLR